MCEVLKAIQCAEEESQESKLVNDIAWAAEQVGKLKCRKARGALI